MVAARLASELRAEWERFRAPIRARMFTDDALLAGTGASSVDQLWDVLRRRPHIGRVDSLAGFEALCPGQRAAIFEGAVRAALHGIVAADVDRAPGSPIAWSRDHRSGVTWPGGYARRLRYADPADDGDVKFPWELSRLQWLLPAGQAYRLKADERYARLVREVLDDWIQANPYGATINWAVAMEAAIRVLSWTWLFHMFAASAEWSEAGFRSRFLRALYLHGDWIERNLERSDVSGNHYTADAAGLVFAGLFFGAGRAPERWAALGWEILTTEIERQVEADGVDFEGSTAYHRLVMEFFLLPALYRERLGLSTPARYRERLVAMARFVAAYSRDDDGCPSWGDGDDGRALPLGSQPLADHRYLIGLVAAGWDVDEVRDRFSGPRDEIFWLLGPDAAARLPSTLNAVSATPAAFPASGVYILRSKRDHVFVDAGPVGMRGRGGHGHNDCLSFDAVLDGSHLFADPGTYVYTASYEWRNRFRGTAFHNTPVVDGEEQNRLDPGLLWALANDARPTVERWQSSPELVQIRASHSGYERLGRPVIPVRTIALDPRAHRLAVFDELRGDGVHELVVPYHMAAGVLVERSGPGRFTIRARGRAFVIAWDPPSEWSSRTIPGWVSPSYGRRERASVIEFVRAGELRPLLVVCVPEAAADRGLEWARSALGLTPSLRPA